MSERGRCDEAARANAAWFERHRQAERDRCLRYAVRLLERVLDGDRTVDAAIRVTLPTFRQALRKRPAGLPPGPSAQREADA